MRVGKKFWPKPVNRIHRTFIYNRRVGGSYGKTCGFLHFPFKEEKLSLRDNFSSMGQSTNNIQ